MVKELRFLRLISSDAVGVVNNQMMIIAIPAAALLILNFSPSQASVLLIAEWLPSVLFATLVGSSVDRFDRTRILICANTLCSFSAIAIALIIVTKPPYILFLIVLLCFVNACGNLMQNICATAALPNSLISLGVKKAIGLQSSTKTIAQILGQGLAGLLAGFGGIISPIYFMIASGLAKFLLFLTPIEKKSRLTIYSHSSITTGSLVFDKDVLKPQSELQFDWQEVLKIRDVKLILLLIFSINMTGSIAEGAFFSYIYKTLLLTPMQVSIMFVAGGMSGVIAALSTGRLVDRFSHVKVSSIAAVGCSLSLWLIPFASIKYSFVTMIFYDVVFTYLVTTFSVSTAMFKQIIVPNFMLGRLTSFFIRVSSVAVIAGLSTSTILLNYFSPLQVLLFSCSLALFSVLLVLIIFRYSTNLASSAL